MNILLIVLTLLMVLGSISYSRLEMFKNYILQQREYQRYVKEEDRAWYNNQQITFYGNELSPHQVSIAALISVGKKKTNEPENLDKRKKNLARLMDLLYRQAPFYKQLLEKRPNLSTDLVDSIEGAIRKLVEISDNPDFTMRSEDDLAKLTLPDPELQNVFYLMLKGNVRKRTKNYMIERNQIRDLKEGEYYSILEFIKYDKGKFNVNAAPPESLELFFEKQTVLNILKARIDKTSLDEFKTLLINGNVEEFDFPKGKNPGKGNQEETAHSNDSKGKNITVTAASNQKSSVVSKNSNAKTSTSKTTKKNSKSKK
jgi:hypothetical protein